MLIRHDQQQEYNKINVSCVERTIYLFDDICAGTVCEVIKYIDSLEKESKKTIELMINSMGGECYAGIALYDRMMKCSAEICTIGIGCVMSMAYLVFLAGNHRYLFKNCILMNHQISNYQAGRLEDLKIEVEECKRIEKQCLTIISERTGQTIKSLEKQISKGNNYITPDRAIKEGIAHKII